MIEFNLLKEGHGILYKRVKPVFFKWFLVTVFVIFSFTTSMFYLKDDIYTVWSIVKNEEEFIDLNVFFNERVKNEKDFSPQEKIPAVEHIRPVISGSLDNKEKEEVKKNIIQDTAVETAVKEVAVEVFEVIAGTCALQESAEHIVKKLSKAGFSSDIKKRKANFWVYAAWFGEFNTIEEMDAVKLKFKDAADFTVQEVDGKYTLRTSSVLFSKEVDKVLKRAKEKGILGKRVKAKEERDAYTVVIQEVSTFEGASLLRKKLKQKGFTSVIARK